MPFPTPEALSTFDAGVADWLVENVPLFDCPERELLATYYFRWSVYHKHIKHTPAGYVVTEFVPSVSWAGIYNTISCAAGHHLYEGRWLANDQYLDDYSRFWCSPTANPRRYSFWIADALYARYQVSGDPTVPLSLLRRPCRKLPRVDSGARRCVGAVLAGGRP